MSESGGTISGMSKRMKIAREKLEMEAAGYRLIRVWVPDYSNPNYTGPRPSDELFVDGETEEDIQAWIDGHVAEVWAEFPDDDWSFGDDDKETPDASKTADVTT